jgi:hypothetical protein
VSNSPIAAGQHAELLAIDTACHGLGGATGAVDRLAGGGALSSIFHMNRLSIHGDRIVVAPCPPDGACAAGGIRRLKVKSLAQGFPLLLNLGCCPGNRLVLDLTPISGLHS